jgi:hypothetical protein
LEAVPEVAVILQVPAARRVTVEPEIVQTDEDEGLTANVTVPDETVACRVTVLPNVWSPGGLKVRVGV